MTAFSVDYDIEALIDKPFNTDTDNNWNNVAIVTRTDQGMGLTVIKLTINPLKNPLQRAEVYDSWKRIVLTNLKHHQMDGLIDSDLPRPAKNASTASAWFKASKTIGEWLIANISTEIYNKIQARTTESLIFADDIWKGIYKEMRGFGMHQEMMQCGAYASLRREDFPTTVAFIDEYCAQNMRLKERKMGVEAYHAMMILLFQVQQVDVRDMALQTMKEKNLTAQTFTYNNFCEYSQDLKGRVLIREGEQSSSSIPAFNGTSSSSSNDSNKPDINHMIPFDSTS